MALFLKSFPENTFCDIFPPGFQILVEMENKLKKKSDVTFCYVIFKHSSC